MSTHTVRLTVNGRVREGLAEARTTLVDFLRETLGLTGRELFAVEGIAGGIAPGKKMTVRATGNGAEKRFTAVARIDTPEEGNYYRHGGILQYVLRRLAGKEAD